MADLISRPADLVSTARPEPVVDSLAERLLRTQSPQIAATTFSACGPCTASGDTSGSPTRTSRPRSAAIARAQNQMFESAIENQ